MSKRKKVPFERSLAYLYPDIAKEWNYEKNGCLSPENVYAKSNKKAWWRCVKNHEWQTKIYQRTMSKTRCPYCTGRYASKENSLALIKPELVYEWHPVKNKDLTPYQVLPYSRRKVWWKCTNGHEWRSEIRKRTEGTNCPHCMGSIKTSFQSLAIYYYFKKAVRDTKREYRIHSSSLSSLDVFIPSLNLAIEYDGEFFHQDKNRDIRKDKRLMNHKRFKNVTLIRIREPNCPHYPSPNPNVQFIYLQNKKDETLEKLIEHLLHVYVPQKKMKVNFKEDRARIFSMINYQKKANSLQDLYPEIAAEWHPVKNGHLRPEHMTPYSNKKVWWKCFKGHEWESFIHSRTQHNSHCPYCSGKYVTIETSLASIYPKLAEEWHPTKNGDLRPSDVTPQSHKEVWWQCSHGFEWKSVIYNRTRLGLIGHRSCPACRKKRRNHREDCFIFPSHSSQTFSKIA